MRKLTRTVRVACTISRDLGKKGFTRSERRAGRAMAILTLENGGNTKDALLLASDAAFDQIERDGIAALETYGAAEAKAVIERAFELETECGMPAHAAQKRAQMEADNGRLFIAGAT